MERTRASWLIWAAVAVGLLLRGYHYGRGPAVWHDEAALLVNVIRLPVTDSFGPLLYDEASPPLFLLLEKAVAAVLGDGEYALRLPSFLAACAAVVFTAFAARRMLPPGWAAIAVGLVAVSDRLLFHASEAKWYSLDVCVAAAAIWAVVATARRPVWARCLVAAAVAPVCIWTSFPACFVCGGVLAAWLPAAWRADGKGKAAFVAFALAVGVSFTLLVVGPAKAQRTKPMEACWSAESGSFANWNNPARVPVWAVANSFDVVRYSFLPYGWPLLVPAVVGVWVLLRNPGGWAAACVTLLPMGLVFVAACLGKYPYTAARTTAFLTPGLALTACVGLRQFWVLVGPSGVWRWAFLLVWVPVLLIPAGYTAWRVVDPWPRAECDRAAAEVQYRRVPGEPVYANHWELDYYLRDLEPGAVTLAHKYVPGGEWDEWIKEHATTTPKPRLWVVHVQEKLPPAELYPLPAGYEVKGERKFGGAVVWEVGPVVG
jgi:hypothetical protein